MTEPITLPLAQVHRVIKPRHMHEGYSSRVCVCLSDCVSVTALVATYLVYMSKVRWHAVSCRLLKIYIVWTMLKMFRSGDMVLFACHDDQQLGSFSTKNTPMVLNTIRNCIVYELLARSDDYLN